MVSGDPHHDPGPMADPHPQAPDLRRQVLVDSLRSRYQSAQQGNDPDAKQALFKEAVYLGIQPEEFTISN